VVHTKGHVTTQPDREHDVSVDFAGGLFALSIGIAAFAGVWSLTYRRIAATDPMASYQRRLLSASKPMVLSLLLIALGLLCGALWGVTSWDPWRAMVAAFIGGSIPFSLMTLKRMLL
jgi:hypothetical protein